MSGRCGLAALLGALVLTSCTRMPTTPRAAITVSGAVTDREGNPVPGVNLLFYPENGDGWDSYPGEITDSLGEYSTRLIEGTYNLRISPPPGAGLWQHVERVSFSSPRARHDVVFAGHLVRGTLLDRSGEPVENALVEAAHTDFIGRAEAAVRQGSYALVLPEGSYVLRARPDALSGSNHFEWKIFGPMPVAADTTVDLTVDGHRIEGQVAGPDGTPLAFLRVSTEPGGYGLAATTGSDGRYRIYAPGGAYRLFLNPAESYILDRISPPFTLEGPTVLDVQITGVEWSGTVRLATSQEPVKDARILARMLADTYGRSALTSSDGEGRFRLLLEPNREYELTVYDQAWNQRRMIGKFIATADTTFDIPVDPPPVP